MAQGRPPAAEPARPKPAAEKPVPPPKPTPAAEKPAEPAPTAAKPPAPKPEPPAAKPPEPASEPIKAERRAEPPAEQDDSQFDGARLVALQMAVAGSTREEVEAELQRAFRLTDPSAILDDVFGESGPRRATA
jgi:outer membrane biosynthesis protein TonB